MTATGRYMHLATGMTDGWVVRLGEREPYTWWWGPRYAKGTAAGRYLTHRVAVFPDPETARQAIRAVGWQPGSGDVVIVSLTSARAALRPRQLPLAL